MKLQTAAVLVSFSLLGGAAAVAATPTLVRFSAGTPARAADVNANFDALAAAIATVIPPGTVLPYAGRTAPAGFLECNGSAVSRETYAALFAAISTTHGAGDGATTFNVPDYRGRFLRGVDRGAGRDLGAAARTAMAGGGVTGDEVGSVEGAATGLPATPFVVDPAGVHSHDAPTTNGNPGTAEVGDSRTGVDYYGGAPTQEAGAHGHTISGGDAETRPVNASVLWIVKT